MTTPPIGFSQRRENTRDLAISYLMQQAVENQGVISLAAGLVDSQALPVSKLHKAAQHVLGDEHAGRKALQYGTTPGYDQLRQQVLRHFATLENTSENGLGIDLDQLILTTGSQQMLSLVSEIMFNPGDICLVAGPTYFVFIGNLAGVGARAITVDTDEQGMCPEALDRTLAQLDAEGLLPRVKLIYVVSYYDNPSGVSVATDRRQAIVDCAQRWSREQRICVLEDAAYRELRYDGEVFPSLWSCDASRDYVIYTQTFSKTLSPGLRVGFGIVPRDVVSPICDRKGNDDFGSPNLNQHLLSNILSDGMYQSHLLEVRAGYQEKRDAMLAAAQSYFNDIPGVSWHHPHGGLYVWMTLPESISTGFNQPLFQAAVSEGVMYVPGELCYAPDKVQHNQMRLSYGVQTPEGINAGMQRLARAVEQQLTVQTNS